MSFHRSIFPKWPRLSARALGSFQSSGICRISLVHTFGRYSTPSKRLLLSCGAQRRPSVQKRNHVQKGRSITFRLHQNEHTRKSKQGRSGKDTDNLKATDMMTSSATAPPSGDVVQIDGSILEGGGQILRNAAALSAIMHKPICVDKIRASRSKPGLRPQHLAGLRLIEKVAQGHLDGGHVDSTTVTLQPGMLQCGDYSSDTGTAGSCTLLAQAALPCLLFAAPHQGTDVSTLDLRGGTDAAMAPPVDYMLHILLPTLRRLFGTDIHGEVQRRGFYPKGGGHISLTIPCLQHGNKLPAFDMRQRGDFLGVRVSAFRSGRVPQDAADRMASSAKSALRKGLGNDVDVRTSVKHETREAAFGDGAGVLMVAETSGGFLLGAAGVGEKGKPAQAVGSTAAEGLVEDIHAGGCVDRWLQDQLIIFMALAEGTSQMTCGEPTLHTRTAMVIAEKLTGANFTVSKPGGKSGFDYWTVTCDGAGIAAGGSLPRSMH